MYLHDLDSLIDFLRKRSQSLRVRVGDHATIQTASELSEATWQERQDIVIETKTPDIFVKLTQRGKVGAIHEGDTDGRTLVDDTYGLLQTWRSPLTRFSLAFFLVALSVALFMAGGTLLAILLTDGKPEGGFARAFGISSGIPFLGLMALSVLTSGHRCVVADRTRREARERTTSILLSLITAVLGGAVGSLLTVALKR